MESETINLPSPGRDTSEYAETVVAGKWGTVVMLLGALGAVGAGVADAYGAETAAGLIAATVVTVTGALFTLIPKMAYIKSRTVVKIASTDQGLPLTELRTSPLRGSLLPGGVAERDPHSPQRE